MALVVVIDKSGSMDGQKIRLAAQAVEEAIGRLKPADRFAVVIYDDDHYYMGGVIAEKLRREGLSYEKIAKEVGVSKSMVHKIDKEHIGRKKS